MILLGCSRGGMVNAKTKSGYSTRIVWQNAAQEGETCQQGQQTGAHFLHIEKLRTEYICLSESGVVISSVSSLKHSGWLVHKVRARRGPEA